MGPVLYRWWDSDGRLLYVGKSISLFARIAQHRSKSAFFPEAATMTLEHFGSAAELSAAEVKAIRAERPAYNVQHSVGREPVRTITVIDGPAPAAPVPDATTGYWSRIDANQIWYSDIIRFAYEDGEVAAQGLIDDDYFPDDAEEIELGPLGEGWYVITDDGTEQVVTNMEIEGLYPLVYRWTCANPDDPYRLALTSNWLDRRTEEREVA